MENNNNDDTYNPEIIPNNAGGEMFEDVFEMVNYDDNEITSNDNSFIVAEYNNIDVVEINKNQQKIAKKFIQEAKKLIISHASDAIIGVEIKNYLSSIENLQLTQLTDLLTLMVFNKHMLQNMVHRINAVQGEDYALVQNYTQLVQQHLKLHRELANIYSNIPAMMKKMTTDINESLLSPDTPDKPVISNNFGVSQFNNTKELLKNIKSKIANKKQEEK